MENRAIFVIQNLIRGRQYGFVERQLSFAFDSFQNSTICKPTRIEFQRHMKWHHLHPGFVCKICSYRAIDKPSYKEHIELHRSKLSPFACVFCDRVYERARELRRHCKCHDVNSHNFHLHSHSHDNSLKCAFVFHLPLFCRKISKFYVIYAVKNLIQSIKWKFIEG